MNDSMQLGSDRVLQHIRNVAKEHLNMTDEQIAAINPDAPILSELPLDSLSQVVLATSIESDFKLTLEPEDWQSVRTVRDLVTLVHSRAKTETTAC
jgi:acyl carrier protein